MVYFYEREFKGILKTRWTKGKQVDTNNKAKCHEWFPLVKAYMLMLTWSKKNILICMNKLSVSGHRKSKPTTRKGRS